MSHPPASSNRRLVLATVLVLAGVLAWDASPLDLLLARQMGGQAGFALREHWLLSTVLHSGARRLAGVLACALVLAIWWPVGPLRDVAPARRVQLALTTVCTATAVAAMKRFSLTSCPWDLQLFGGIAQYASHWSAWPDGGAGQCFPAGHASSGFSFVGGYFALRETAPRAARRWLLAAVAAGLALGTVQQLRGAHFMSHTLWTGCICWCIALGIEFAARAAGSLRGRVAGP